jgi:hypothetical protein
MGGAKTHELISQIQIDCNIRHLTQRVNNWLVPKRCRNQRPIPVLARSVFRLGLHCKTLQSNHSARNSRPLDAQLCNHLRQFIRDRRLG